MPQGFLFLFCRGPRDSASYSNYIRQGPGACLVSRNFTTYPILRVPVLNHNWKQLHSNREAPAPQQQQSPTPRGTCVSASPRPSGYSSLTLSRGCQGCHLLLETGQLRSAAPLTHPALLCTPCGLP